MNTKKEIVDVFDGSPSSDLPPPAVFTQTGTVEQMDACGSAWPDANFDADGMAALALEFPRQYGFATVRVPFCLTVESQRLGADLNPGRGDCQPSVVGSPFRTADGFMDPPDDLMTPDEFVSGGRCAMVAEVAERISREREDLFVTAGMQCPASVAIQLVGAESFLMTGMMEPDRARRWVETTAPYQCAYAERLSEAADNVLIIADASTDLQTPDMYAELSEPFLRRTVSSVRSSFSTIHTCGDTTLTVGSLAGIGATGLSLEASHDPEWFLRAVGGRSLMFGSIDPVGTLLMKGPEDVAREARMYADMGFDAITPECGVPPQTPGENLAALARYRGC